MRKPQLMTANRIPEALSNLTYRGTTTVMDIMDAVEDSATGAELVKRLNALDLPRFTLDRETETYARLKTVDPWGGVSYLVARK